MRSATKLLGLVGVLSIAFLAGRSSWLRSAEPVAFAGPTWDASHNTWVESSGGALVMWKMDGDKVAGVTVHYLSTEPAVYDVKPPEKDGKAPDPVERFPAGDYVFTRTYKPAPAGMPEPAAGPLSQRAGVSRDAASLYRAAAPAPAAPSGGQKAGGGQGACGAGKCG